MKSQLHRVMMVMLVVWVGGCNVLRVYEPVRVRINDWAMYGGNPSRTHFAGDAFGLPGEQVWEYAVNAGFGNTSAVVVDSLVFVGTLQGELHVVRIRNGRRVGSTDLGSSIVGSPAVTDELVYVPMSRNDENLLAYDLNRAAIAWRLKTGDIETSPLIVENRLYVTTMRGELICVERISGEIAWRYEIPSPRYLTSIRSSPATDLKRIFFGADDGKLYAVGIGDGKLHWTFASSRGIVATPSVSDGRVFVASTDRFLYCLDGETGALVWKRDLGSRLFAMQAIGHRRVFVGSAGGELFSVDQRTGEIVWKFQVGSVISAAPLISGGVVFVGSLDKHLYALDAQTGQMLWSKEFSSRLKTTPVSWRGHLIVLLEDRKMVAFHQRELSPEASRQDTRVSEGDARW